MVDQPGDRRPAQRLIIVCPLRYEQRILVRKLRDIEPQLTVPTAIVGPGPVNMSERVRRIQPAVNDGPSSLVLLAGLAGSLRHELPIGEAAWIARIVDPEGNVIAEPSFLPGLRDQQGRAALSVKTVIDDATERASLAEHSNADLVDMESEAFAALATDRGWTWGIVRGISDTPSTGLPACASRWTSSRGGSRPTSVLRSVLQREIRLGDLYRLHQNSTMAMQSVARSIFQSQLLRKADRP